MTNRLRKHLKETPAGLPSDVAKLTYIARNPHVDLQVAAEAWNECQKIMNRLWFNPTTGKLDPFDVTADRTNAARRRFLEDVGLGESAAYAATRSAL